MRHMGYPYFNKYSLPWFWPGRNHLIFFGGRNDWNLYLTTKQVCENFCGGISRLRAWFWLSETCHEPQLRTTALSRKRRFKQQTPVKANCRELICRPSGDSRMKKWERGTAGPKINVGGEHKYFSCMVTFCCNEDWFAMINPIKSNIDLWMSSEPSPESLQ